MYCWNLLCLELGDFCFLGVGDEVISVMNWWCGFIIGLGVMYIWEVISVLGWLYVYSL